MNLRYFLLPPALLVLSACSRDMPSVSIPDPTAPAISMQALPQRSAAVWLTTADGAQKLAPQSSVLFKSKLSSTTSPIRVDPTITYQSIKGFGAALTESSAYLLSDRMSPAQRADLLKDLFDPERGIGLSYLRIPLGASDFARSSYTYHDLPHGQTDETLASFAVERDEQYVLPVAQQISAVSPDVRFMGSPWSAPAWMKDSEHLNWGGLRPAWMKTYAAYLTRTAQSYAARGVPLDTLTLQNEPRFESGTYPSMRLEPAEAADLSVQLGQSLRSAGLPVGLLGWDHNWDDTEYPLALLGYQGARDNLVGTAFHCYAGDVDAQSTVHEAYPDKDVYFTECSGGAWATNWGANLGWNMQHLIIGATRNWARTVLLWNLALDPQGGPTNGGCSDCRGVVTVDPATGGVRLNEEYYALGHAAKFVRPGAVRIASSSYGAGKVQSVAFRSPDGTRVLIVFNGSASARKVTVLEDSSGFIYSLSGGAVATFIWPAP